MHIIMEPLSQKGHGGTFSSLNNMLMNSNIVIGVNVTFSVYRPNNSHQRSFLHSQNVGWGFAPDCVAEPTTNLLFRCF